MSRPITILVAALGGEGGGVLADWLISAANAHDFPVQSTSIPGVAQRTGATTYYIEIFPVTRSELGGRKPVFSLTPSPGDVDVAVASELLEAARIVAGGFAHPKRTAVIGSTHREYAVSEKIAMADGRYESGKALEAVRAMARVCALFDMHELAWRNGTVINTIMFGAMAGLGVLPLSRTACEEAIRASGKAVEASLKGFAAGYAAAVGTAASDDGAAAALSTPASLRDIVRSGVELTTDYQDVRYGQQYKETVESIQQLERDAGGGPGGFAATMETARYLALWMCYEDVIRVADLKTRRVRLERVRQEIAAKPKDVVHVTEFMKPGVEELTSILPPAVASWVTSTMSRRARPLHIGLHIRTDTIAGFSLLCLLRGLRVWRRKTSRFRDEHDLIAQWLDSIRHLLHTPGAAIVAYELALAGNLVKGYGQTHARGRRNMLAILRDVDENHLLAAHERAARVRRAREAALDDPEGRKLAQTLGLPQPELVARPITFHKTRGSA